jgi:phage recombination protein Bet
VSESTALVPVESTSSALVTREYLEEKAALVRQLYAKGTNDLEFEHFIEVCATRGLNPLAKQIYCVMRWDSKEKREVPTIQTSIDGYRLIAQRTGGYRGQVGPQWCGQEGVWRDVWLEDAPPAASRVGVMREGFTEPVYGVARWASYVQTTKEGKPTKFWAQMPDVMLAKVAESLALRKAFPEELSGLYTTEEMGQAPQPAAQSSNLGRERFLMLRESGLADDEIAAALKAEGIASSGELEDDNTWELAKAAVGLDEAVEGEVVA